jgi:hypothetical protein
MPGHLMAATDRFAANGADRFLPASATPGGPSMEH